MKKILELKYNDSNDTIEVIYNNCSELDNYIQLRLLPKNRCWSKDLKCWVVTPDQISEIALVGSGRFDEIKYFSLPPHLQARVKESLDSNNFSSKSPPTNDVERNALYLTPDAPEFLVRAAYKALAKHYHPDNKDTGDEERFKVVSEAYRLMKL